jgi:hypothetical protein
MGGLGAALRKNYLLLFMTQDADDYRLTVPGSMPSHLHNKNIKRPENYACDSSTGMRKSFNSFAEKIKIDAHIILN